MSGYEVIRHLKASLQVPADPVLIITTSARSPEVEKRIEADAVGYYRKPNSIAQLNTILKELCSVAVKGATPINS